MEIPEMIKIEAPKMEKVKSIESEQEQIGQSKINFDDTVVINGNELMRVVEILNEQKINFDDTVVINGNELMRVVEA